MCLAHTSSARAILSACGRLSTWSQLKPPDLTKHLRLSVSSVLLRGLHPSVAVRCVDYGNQSLRSDPPYVFVVIPRARRVHQSLFTTPFTAVTSLAASVWHLTIAPLVSKRVAPDVLLLNGPGTCFVLCIATYVNRVRRLVISLSSSQSLMHVEPILQFFGLKSPRLIYIESFARVRHLSLSARLLRPLVNRYAVHITIYRQ